MPFDNAVGAAKIAIGSYTGTGTYGVSNPNTLIFDFNPKIVLIAYTGKAGYLIAIREAEQALGWNGNEGINLYLEWGENSLLWHSTSGALRQFNSVGDIYPYLALGL